MNGVLAGAILGGGIVGYFTVGITIGVINFAATFDGIARNSVYQGILGWTSWLMPMSWGAMALGLACYTFDIVMANITFNQWDAAKIDKVSIAWKTGSMVMSGGLVKNPKGGFDMGNFVFVQGGSSESLLRHETGHTLTIAAFGTAFSICDVIRENLGGANFFKGKGTNDFGEMIAESHASRDPDKHSTIPMWG